MNNYYLVAGFRKGAKESDAFNLNTYLFADEKSLRNMFVWIDGPDGNLRKGTLKLTLNDIINEIKNVGKLWCENDDFCYVFKLNPKHYYK